MTASNRRPTVLVVDDSGIQREVLSQVLERHGYGVVAASGGLEGIASAYEQSPDVIVCDVVMPEISGYHVCRFVKNEEALADIPVVLMTSSAVQRQDRFWGLQSGADAYITKSDDPEALLSTLRRLAPGDASGGPARQARPAQRRKPEQISSYLNYLLDKLLFETTVTNEIRRLGELVHDKGALLSELATVVESLVEHKALGVAIVALPRTYVHVTLKERAGRLTMRELRKALAAGTEHPELRDAKADVDLVLTPAELNDPDHAEPRPGPPVCCQLTAGGKVLGAICVVPTTAEPLSEAMQAQLALAARELSPIISTLAYYEEARHLSQHDGLTGLHNYRHFLSSIDQEFRRFKRYATKVSMIMLDLDGFKQVNDVYGHLAGDVVLKGVARVLRQMSRNVDVTARYGGDEFVLMLPETDLAGAAAFGERLREAIGSARFLGPGGEPLHVTASVGVSTVTDACRRSSDLIGAADGALYRSKESGKNRVSTALHEPDGNAEVTPSPNEEAHAA